MLSSNPPSPTRNPESTGKYDGSHCLADSSVDNIRSNSDAAYKLDKYQIQTQPPPLAPSPLRQTATAASKQLYHERTSSTSGSVRSVFSSSTSVISAGLLLPASFDPASTASLANGVIYEYYRGEFESLPDFNQIPHLRRKIGVTAGINIDSFSEISHFGLEDSVAENNDFVEGNFAVRYTGMIKIPQDGIWTFTTNSNDGSALFIGGKKVVDNDGSHYATEKHGRARLAAGYYPFTLSYFHKQGKIMEGIRTGPYLTLCWSCASQNWLSYGAVGEMSRKQLIANTCLFYNFNNPILLPPQLSAADSAEDMMRLAAEDENLSFDTPFSRIAQLQEDMAHLSSDYEDRIANLESQIEAEKLKSTIMLRKISSCIALKSSASSTSAPHSFANNNHNNSPLEDLSMSRDSIETTQFEAMIDESDSRQEMLQVLSQINQLRTQAFFSMGLAYKLSTGISLNLHDLWDRVETENIPIESWSKMLSNQI